MNGNSVSFGSVQNVSPVKEVQVKCQMNSQTAALEELAKTVSVLEARLAPVLRSSTPQTENDLVKAEALVPHAEDIRLAAGQVRLQTAILRSILDRLEI